MQISIGLTFSAARRSDGAIIAWGDNSYGQLNVPALPAGIPCVGVSAGYRHALGLLGDGTIIAWGHNFHGEINVPQLPSGVTWTQAVAGISFSAGLRSDGIVQAWGDNYYGQTNVPTLPAGLFVVEIATGGSNVVARLSDGSVILWGFVTGQFVPPLLPGQAYTRIYASIWHTLLVRNDAVLLDTGGVQPTQAPPGQTYVELGVGIGHGAGLLSNGQLVTWGSNSDCQRNVPPAPPGTNYVDVAAGPNHYVGLLSDGMTTTWGDEGPVSSIQLSLPLLPSGVGYKAIACGQAYNLGLRTDGIVETAPAQVTLPMQTPPLSYVQIDANGGTSVGRLSDGSAIAVGTNFTTGQPVTLSPVPAGVTILDIVAGWSHVARLRSDGIVTIDGSNSNGQHAVPVLPAGVSFVSLAASTNQTLGVLSDGTITGWGSGYYPNAPAPPPGLRYLQAAAGAYHGLGLLSDGTIAGWGYIGGYYSISGETLVPAPPAGSWFSKVNAAENSSVAIYERIPWVSFCSGDGSGTACPCGNSGAMGHGCASSVSSSGARLVGWGRSSLTSDTFQLSGSDMPNSSALYFQGTTQQSAGAGSVFGDGLRCAGGSVTRLGPHLNSAGASQYPSPGEVAISVKGAVLSPGTRTYQVWYRNAAAFCTPSTFNVTNGAEVTWSM